MRRRKAARVHWRRLTAVLLVCYTHYALSRLADGILSFLKASPRTSAGRHATSIAQRTILSFSVTPAIRRDEAAERVLLRLGGNRVTEQEMQAIRDEVSALKVPAKYKRVRAA
jgi:hypothetical protein